MTDELKVLVYMKYWDSRVRSAFGISRIRWRLHKVKFFIYRILSKILGRPIVTAKQRRHPSLDEIKEIARKRGYPENSIIFQEFSKEELLSELEKIRRKPE